MVNKVFIRAENSNGAIFEYHESDIILCKTTVMVIHSDFTLLNYVYYLVSGQEFKRLKEAFKRNSSQNAYISKLCFTKDVLGEYVPPSLAEVSSFPYY